MTRRRLPLVAVFAAGIALGAGVVLGGVWWASGPSRKAGGR